MVKLLSSLRALNLGEDFEPTLKTMSGIHDITFDECTMIDSAEDRNVVELVWYNMGKFLPYITIWGFGDELSATWESCLANDITDEGERFEFDPRSHFGWQAVLYRLLYLREVAFGDGAGRANRQDTPCLSRLDRVREVVEMISNEQEDVLKRLAE